MTGDWREEAIADYHVLLDFYERYPGFELLAAKLRAAGPPPRSLYGTPLILDIGPSPDDILAVACAAAMAPELALLIAADQDTARLARHVLDLLGRDVPVTCASPQSAPRDRVPAELIPSDIPAQPSGAVGAAGRVCAGTSGPARWVSTYFPITLAHALARDPQIAARLVITHTGGTPARDPHDSLQRDPDAAHALIATATRLYLATTTVTTSDAIAMRDGSEMHTRLADVCRAAGAAVVADDLAQWFTTVSPVIHLRAVLTLCLGQRMPFVSCTRRDPFRLDQHARMIPTPNVIPDPDADHRRIWTTRHVNPAFARWIGNKALR